MIPALVLGFFRSKWGGVIAAAGLLALSLTLLIGLTMMTGQKIAADHRANSLARQIDDPKTGFRAQLSSCRADFDGEKRAYLALHTTLDAQTASLVALKAESDRRTAAATADARAARAAYARLGGAQAILNAKPTGDVCAAAEKVLSGELP